MFNGKGTKKLLTKILLCLFFVLVVIILPFVIEKIILSEAIFPFNVSVTFPKDVWFGFITYLYNDVCIREEPNGEKKCMLSVKDSYYHDMIWRACNIGGMYKNVQEERKQRAIVSKDKLVEIIEEEFGLNRLVKFEEIMQKGYAKEVVQYLYWARERYEFAVNYIDSISVKYLTDEKDFASMLEEL